jgi:hypothetical protein
MTPTKILFAFFFCLGTITEICAGTNPLLHCLAKEENELHKEKNTGPMYRLNQEFINELATSNDINLKRIYIDEICQSKKHSPSVALLRLLLLKEADIYDLSLSGVDPSLKSFKMNYINEFQKQVPRILIQFLSSLQAEMATPHCLEKAIPELKDFNDKLKYLEEDLSTHEVLKDKKKIESIFLKLQDLQKIKLACEEKAKLKAKKLKAQINTKINTKY